MPAAQCGLGKELRGRPQTCCPTGVAGRAVERGLIACTQTASARTRSLVISYSTLTTLSAARACYRCRTLLVALSGCSGTFILGGTDEIQALLDDQIVKTQAMRASPYIKPLEAQATKWETMLTTLQVRPRLR